MKRPATPDRNAEMDLRESDAGLLAGEQVLTDGNSAAQVAGLAARLRRAYGSIPVSQAEWDAASGEP